jgi:hypothetical protein
MVIPIPVRTGRENEVRSSLSFLANADPSWYLASEKDRDAMRCGLRLSAGKEFHIIADDKFAADRMDVQVSAAIEKA